MASDKNSSPIDLELLQKRVVVAIFDPGTFVGPKGDRSLSIWQADAVMFIFRQMLVDEPCGKRA